MEERWSETVLEEEEGRGRKKRERKDGRRSVDEEVVEMQKEERKARICGRLFWTLKEVRGEKRKEAEGEG